MPVSKTATIALAALFVLGWDAPGSAQLRQGPVVLPPVRPACISSPFGPRVLANQPRAGTYHYGVDLPAPEGTPVVAAGAGTVIRVQNRGPGGLEMLVQHNGFVAIYSHFAMVMPEFVAGKRIVVAGEQLGMVGNTGVSSGAHLYFEMDLGGKPVDPAPYLHVPQCNGEIRGGEIRGEPPRPAVEKPLVRQADAGELIGTRKYYQIFPIAGADQPTR